MVERTQAQQPRWITPLATVTPRLEQEFRFDVFSQSLDDHGRFNNYGGDKERVHPDGEDASLP
jgi:hypothetical protein